MHIDFKSAPVQKIEDEILNRHNIRLFVKRLDLIHPTINGNKWYKLKYNLIEAEKQNKKTILTLGGAYSNHIAATAAAGRAFGLKTIGVIRGEEHPVLNPTLKLAQENGMKLFYVSRSLYRDKEKLIREIEEKYIHEDFYFLPEGGSNQLALKGCSGILNDIDIDFSYVCCPCGTGATLAGLILSLKEYQLALGFAVLKGAEFLNLEVESFLKVNKHNANNWTINFDYHFGGYAKVTPDLLKFVYEFYEKHRIQLDHIYTAKMFFGIYDLIEKGYFLNGSKLIAIHTGGLQGNKGFGLL